LRKRRTKERIMSYLSEFKRLFLNGHSVEEVKRGRAERVGLYVKDSCKRIEFHIRRQCFRKSDILVTNIR